MSYKNGTVLKNYVLEGIEINKSNKSKECMLCHYWYFKDIGCKFESRVYNKCHDVLMIAYEIKQLQY